jgi:hypothetical protein
MKDFMVLLFASAEHNIESVPAEQRGAIYEKFGAWVQGLAQKGQLVGGDPLSNSRMSMRAGNKSVSDGPYIESKEFMNGYFRIRAVDLNDAMELCRNHPCFLYGGGLEVVEIATLGGGLP